MTIKRFYSLTLSLRITSKELVVYVFQHKTRMPHYELMIERIY